MTEVQQLTGEQVRTWREEAGLSRREFAEACGFPTQTRLFNIEQKDSWKSGDLEAVTAAMAQIAASGPKLVGRRKRKKGETAEEKIDRLENKLRASGKLIRELPDPDTIADEIELTTGGDPPDLEDPSLAVWDDEPSQAAEPGSDDDYLQRYGLTRAQYDAQETEFLQEYTQDDEAEDEPTITDQDPFEGEIRELQLAGEKLLTNSEVSVWNRCRRKWWFAFYRDLVYGQIDYSGPREIGNRVHRALAAWYVPEGVTPVDPRVALEQAIAEDWKKIEASVREFGVQGDLDQVLADRSVKFNEACTLEKAMIEGYMDWLAEEAQDANLRVTAPEAVVTAKIEDEVAGEKVSFTALGKMDMRARRASDGVRLFLDHKTTGSLVEPRKTLHMDPQMLHYHLLEFLNSSEGDERCDAALYNMLKKVKRTGTAKPPFFDRVEVHHNQHEIESYKKRLTGAARDIMRVTKELDDGADPLTVVYPNPTRNCAWDCDFFVICPMVDDGSRVEDAISSLYHTGDPLARYAKEQEVGGI